MKKFKYIAGLVFITIVMLSVGCLQENKRSYTSPPGYDFSAPQKFNMHWDLREISGIAFLNGDTSTMYAEEDEDGIVYSFHLGDKKVNTTRFEGHGDFEDIAICKGYVIMLRSEGVLFTFPLSETKKQKADKIKRFDNILPGGSYEGLYADEQTGKLYVMCKSCGVDDNTKASSGYIFQLQDDGSVKKAGGFSLNVRSIEKMAGLSEVHFHPSALTRNPVTGQWYILSSDSKRLVIADEKWDVQQVHSLDPQLFQQPEGIVFDKDQNLYISNEKNGFDYGTVLKFMYHK